MKNTFILSTVLATLFTQSSTYASTLLIDDGPTIPTSGAPDPAVPAGTEHLPSVTQDHTTLDGERLAIIMKYLSDTKNLQGFIEQAYAHNPAGMNAFYELIKPQSQATISAFNRLAKHLFRGKNEKIFNGLFRDKHGILETYFKENHLNFSAFGGLLNELKTSNNQGVLTSLKNTGHRVVHGVVDLLPHILSSPLHEIAHHSESTVVGEHTQETDRVVRSLNALNNQLQNITSMPGATVDETLIQKIQEALTAVISSEKYKGAIESVATHLFELIKGTIEKKTTADPVSDTNDKADKKEKKDRKDNKEKKDKKDQKK